MQARHRAHNELALTSLERQGGGSTKHVMGASVSGHLKSTNTSGRNSCVTKVSTKERSKRCEGATGAAGGRTRRVTPKSSSHIVSSICADRGLHEGTFIWWKRSGLGCRCQSRCRCQHTRTQVAPLSSLRS